MRPGEKSPDLGFCLPDGSSAGDDVGPQPPAFSKIALSQMPYGCFVNSRNGPNRTRNKMQFVLNNEFRGKQWSTQRLPTARLSSVIETIIIDALNMPEELY